CLECVQQIETGALPGQAFGEYGEQVGQGRAAEVGKAQAAQSVQGELVDGVERDNVTVLQSCQAEVLLAGVAPQLEDHEPAGQRHLSGEENPRVGATAQIGQQLELTQPRPGLREGRSRSGAQQLLTSEQCPDLSLPAGETSLQVGEVRLLAIGLAKADLL